MNIIALDKRDVGMLANLVKLTLVDRYVGSAIGIAWAILSPLMLMGIFTFVFSFVFPGRLPGREGTLPYVIWLLSGFGPWLAINEGVMTSTLSVVSNAGIVKNIAFKSEILPVVGAIVGLLPLVVAIPVLFTLLAVSGETPKLAIVVLPFVVLLQVAFVSGLGLFLAALNVFVRDTALLLPNVLTILLFASPIFYPVSAYPEGIRPIVAFNPFYIITECYRAPILNGELPPLWMIIYLTVISVVMVVLGLWWFRRLKPFFDTRL